MSDDDIIDSDGEINEAEHSSLLAAVTQIEGKQRVKPSTRKEPSLEVSEFHLVKSSNSKEDAVRVHELAQALGKHSSHSGITQKIQSTKRHAKTLPKPLEKPEANRIDRTVRYENVKHQLDRWDAVVQANRLSNNLSFPLNQPSVRMQSSSEFLKKFKPQTPLEIEIAEILNEGKPVSADKAEEESEFPLTLQEMVERREELIQLRAKQWARESKAARQKKIKSKKYHRILRKEKIKEQLKDFEVLKKTDPEAALERLELLDKTRAEERASLRHRSTGQWARNRAVRAKYDKESRQVLAQQLSISRELTQRVHKEGSSDDEDDNELAQTALNSDNNPWVDSGLTASAEVSEFVSGYRKYYGEKMNEQANKGKKNSNNKLLVESVNEDDILEIIDNDGSSPINKQNKKIKFTKSVTNSISLNKEELEIHSDVGKAKRNKRLKSETNSHVKLAENFSKKINDKSRKRACTTDTSQQFHEDLEPKLKKKMSDKNMKSKNKKCKDITPKVIATTAGWTVVSSDVVSSDTQTVNNKTTLNGQSKKLKHASASVNMDELFDGIDKKFKNKLNKKIKNIKDKMNIENGEHTPEKHDENDLGASLAFKKSASRPVIDEELNEGTHRGPSMAEDRVTSLAISRESTQEKATSEKNTRSDIDPNRFLAIKPKHLKTQLPDVVTVGEEALDDDAERYMTITEAFAEDDVVAEFRKEKEEAATAPVEKDINLHMPGWGQWGGKDLPTLPRKKKRMITKKPIEVPRKDSNKGDVIINENKDAKIKEHLVNALPFPFTSVKSFEASIRAPIGNTWVPATSFWQLTNPEVQTKLGAIIEPMDENELVNFKNKSMKMNWGGSSKK